jgi:sec-independent protein translocase protein TatB
VFDIGWQELLVIAVVTVVVIGPKDLPRVLRAVTLGIRKVRGMARDFQDSIDELAREAELQELRKEIEQAAAGTDIEKELNSIADPAREMEEHAREIARSLEAPAEPEKPALPPAAPDSAGAGAKKAGDVP